MGLSTLYLTSYAPGLRCIALENIPEFASIARIAFEKAARNPVDLRTGTYKELLPQALEEMKQVDFVFLIHYMNNKTTFGCLMNAVNMFTTVQSLFLRESKQAVR